jgi:hypothetical protein
VSDRRKIEQALRQMTREELTRVIAFHEEHLRLAKNELLMRDDEENPPFGDNSNSGIPSD